MRRLLGILGLTLGCSAGSGSAPRPPEATAAEVAAGVSRALDQWSQEDLESSDCSLFLSACTDRLVRKAGLSPEGNVANPRTLLENPDPEWLVGWEQAPTRPEESFTVLRALTYARSMRVHFDRCRALHDERMRTLAEIDETVSREVAAASSVTDSYQRLGALLRLRSEIKLKTEDLAGPRYRLELIIADAFRTAGKKRVYDFQHQRDEQAPLLRPLLDRERELLYTCSKDLPSWQDPEALPSRLVRQALDRDARDLLDQSIKGARDLESRIEVESVEIPAFDAPSTKRTDGPLAVVAREAFGVPLRVARLTPTTDSQRVVLVLEGRATVKDAPYDCKEVDRDGEGPSDPKAPSNATAKETVCKRRTERRRVTVSVAVAEPPKVGIAADDEVIVWVFPKKFESRERPQTDGSVDVEVTAEVDAFHVAEVWRRGIVVAEYFN
jgi:hypothetical protein